jgi:hypothetical protein
VRILLPGPIAVSPKPVRATRPSNDHVGKLRSPVEAACAPRRGDSGSAGPPSDSGSIAGTAPATGGRQPGQAASNAKPANPHGRPWIFQNGSLRLSGPDDRV